MIDLEHCTILGKESIDSNSLNRCLFNLFTKMGEFNSNFLNATSENVPSSPFFSGGYENALTDNPSITSLHASSISVSHAGLAKRLYCGDCNIMKPSAKSSFLTDSVTGTYLFSQDEVSSFVPTVESLLREENPLILKSVLSDESLFYSEDSTLNSSYSPIINCSSFLLSVRNGISFGTITLKRNNGDIQESKIRVNLKTDLVKLDGVNKIKFFKISNGYNSGIRSISEDCDMVTDMGTCNVTYEDDSNIIITSVTKNDGGDSIIVDSESGRILNDDEEYDYSKCIKLTNDEVVLNFFVIFELKDNYLKYSDDLWCFNLVSDKEFGREYYYDSTGWAENYYKYSFANFEAADCGKEDANGGHILWPTDETELGGCTYIASNAFRGCTNATFESLYWFSPRLREASNMFRDCKLATFDSLTGDLSLDRIRKANRMFYNCKSAEFLNLTSISLSSASNVKEMFALCEKAKFDNLDTMTLNGDCSYMFKEDINANFNNLLTIAGSAYNLDSIFSNCTEATFKSLREIRSDDTGIRDIDIKQKVGVYAPKMFYNLTNATFENLTGINITNPNGYDATSMFESCSNANLSSLVHLGNVKCADSMFRNVDSSYEDANYPTYKKSRFENLTSFGPCLQSAVSMFENDRYLTLHNKDINVSLTKGDSAFKNTSSVIFDGNLYNLSSAVGMFDYVNTVKIIGSMNALTNGNDMFSHCVSCDVSGTTNSLVNMTRIFNNTDYVHFYEVPSSARDMVDAFSNVTGECYVGNWKSPVNLRYCSNTFQDSKNVWINGNIVNGNIHNTMNMFCNCTDGLVLNNPDMTSSTDKTHRYFTTDGLTSYFGLFENFDKDDTTNNSIVHATFIGNIEPTNSSIASIVESSDVVDSIICFETQSHYNHNYYAFSVSGAGEPQTDDMIKFNIIGLNGNNPLTPETPYTVKRYSKSRIVEYGTMTCHEVDDGNEYNMVFTKNLNPNSGISFVYTNSVSSNDDSDLRTRIKTFNIVDNSKFGPNWFYADKMFYNVVQSHLLSGYDCLLSDSLIDTTSMFELEIKPESDETFSDAGKLFRKMGHSNIKNMSRMFRNRHISDLTPFIDLYAEDEHNNKSFLIPYSVVDASSAFQGCSFTTTAMYGDEEKTENYISLDIPKTLTNASCMLSGYTGPKIKFNSNDGKWITINETLGGKGPYGNYPNIYCMFYGCEFFDSGDNTYNINVPDPFTPVFSGSDFSMGNVERLEFPKNKNFAHPHSNDDFFYNETKMLGCSSISFRNLKQDITDWLVGTSTTTDEPLNIEGIYFATIIAPPNSDDCNYEVLSANGDEGDWVISLSPTSQFTDNMRTALYRRSNWVGMNNVSSLSNDNARLACMFNPSVAFYASNKNGTIGDRLKEYVRTGDVSNTQFNDINANCNSKCFTSITFTNLQHVDAKELPFAFYGMSNANFVNLVDIGPHVINGYAAFADCHNATFSSLSSISFFQTDTEVGYESSYLNANDSYLSSWYGNYGHMFRGDSKATFNNLQQISLNTVHSVDLSGNDIEAWIGINKRFNWSCYVKDENNSTYKAEYEIDKKIEGTEFDISVTKKYQNKTLEPENYCLESATKDTVIENIELADVEDELEVILTLRTESNDVLYYSLNVDRAKEGTITVTEHPYHPKTGYAAYNSKYFSVKSFYTSSIETEEDEEGNTITKLVLTPNIDNFTDLDNKEFTLRASDIEDEELDLLKSPQPTGFFLDEDECFTFGIIDSSDGDILHLATPYKKYTVTKTDGEITSKSHNASSMYYSRLSYADDDGVNYTAIAIFKDTPVYVNGRLRYPSDAISYRMHTEDDYTIIDENLVIPGSVISYKVHASVSDLTMGRHANFRGMFKGCTGATFENLKTIRIPVTGDCAYMFEDCKNFHIDDRIETMVLPVCGDYTGMFKGMDAEYMDFSWANTSKTNFVNLQMGSDNKSIGPKLFSGVCVSGESKVYGDKNFNYQNAIYDIKMKSDLAKEIFNRGDCRQIRFRRVDGSNIEITEVEQYEYDDVHHITPVYKPFLIPAYNISDPYIWSVYVSVDERWIPSGYIPSNTTTFTHSSVGNLDIIATTDTDEGKSLVAHYMESESLSYIAAGINEGESIVPYNIVTASDSTPN